MFAEAWRDSGGLCREPVELHLPSSIRKLLSRVLSWSWGRHKDRLIIPIGWRIDSVAWPYCWKYEIVPMMWDLWPSEVPAFKRFCRRNKVELVFCTQRQTVARLVDECPGVKIVWIPEGVDISRYPMGVALSKRSIDIFNYGRACPFGKQLESSPHKIILDSKGFDFNKLTSTIRDSKITLCYPRCDTSPGQAGGIETLTQRYWECMLSGALPVGRAPQELVDLCGYNPVVDASDGLRKTCDNILRNIEEFQPLVNKNEETARAIAGWSERMGRLHDALQDY